MSYRNDSILVDFVYHGIARLFDYNWFHNIPPPSRPPVSVPNLKSSILTSH